MATAPVGAAPAMPEPTASAPAQAEAPTPAAPAPAAEDATLIAPSPAAAPAPAVDDDATIVAPGIAPSAAAAPVDDDATARIADVGAQGSQPAPGGAAEPGSAPGEQPRP